MVKFIIHAFAVAFSVLALASPGSAQNYPDRPIRIICSFAAGSGADVLVRYYAQKLGEVSGATVFVENKVGAQGNIGTDAAAHAKPDGYTILITANTVLAAAPHLFKQLSFDPAKDFEAVGSLAKLSFVYAVNAESPVRTIADLTAQLGTKGKRGFYGATTNTGIVAAELYKQSAKLETERVPYKNVGDALGGISQSEVDFIVFDTTWTLGQVRSGKLRALAVTSGTRSNAFPDVPTMADLGFKGLDLTPWWGVVVPRGVPKPIVEKLSAWFRQVANADDTKKFLANVATDPFPSTAEEMQKLLDLEIKRWGEFVALAKIDPQ
jgi:tripartite-type tricarboxylate transporter receptor subunit TctC